MQTNLDSYEENSSSYRITMVTVIKYVTYATGIFFLYSLFSMMYLRQHYTRHMPQTEQIESGRTVPIEVNYGKIVYVTEIEKERMAFKYYSFGGACILVLLILCVRPFVKDSP